MLVSIVRRKNLRFWIPFCIMCVTDMTLYKVWYVARDIRLEPCKYRWCQSQDGCEGFCSGEEVMVVYDGVGVYILAYFRH